MLPSLLADTDRKGIELLWIELRMELKMEPKEQGKPVYKKRQAQH